MVNGSFLGFGVQAQKTRFDSCADDSPDLIQAATGSRPLHLHIARARAFDDLHLKPHTARRILTMFNFPRPNWLKIRAESPRSRPTNIYFQLQSPRDFGFMSDCVAT
jgi:hypothetical protein